MSKKHTKTAAPEVEPKVWKLVLPPQPTRNNDPEDHPYFHYGDAVPPDGSLGPQPKHGFWEDWRKTNPGLHLLYVKTAVRHLRLIDNQLSELHMESNLNLTDMIEAMQHQRMVLVFSNAAYWDAAEILRGLRLDAGSRIVGDEQ